MTKGSGDGCNDERLFATFVVGAPACLTKNISSEATELGIHNGTKCVLHSIGYLTSGQLQAANDLISQTAIGAVAWVESPDFIVVDIGPRPDLVDVPRSAAGHVLLVLRPGELECLDVVVTVQTDNPANPEPITRLSSLSLQSFDVDLTWSITSVAARCHVQLLPPHTLLQVRQSAGRLFGPHRRRSDALRCAAPRDI